MMQYGLFFVLAMVWMWLWVKAAKYFWVLDKPWPDVPKRDRVPTMQWVVAVGIVFIATYVLRSSDFWMGSPFFGLWMWLGIILLVTFLDELGRIVDKRLRVSAIVRLFAHGAAVAVAMWWSGVGIFWFEWINGTYIELGWFTSLVLTFARFILFINAINRFDWIYGLATWQSSLWFGTIVLLLLCVVIPFYEQITPEKLQLLQDVSRYAYMFFVVTLLWTIVEFRPTGLMRDVGTMSFGFALAYLSLLWWAKIWTMIVVLMLPLFDAIWVLFDRLHRRKKNPLQGDFSHLHYRLLALQWSRTEVRVCIRWTSAFFAVLMLLQGTERLQKIILFMLIALIFFVVNRYLFRKKWLPSEYDRKKDERI